MKNMSEDDDASKDCFAVIASYFDQYVPDGDWYLPLSGVEEATVALRALRALVSDNQDNRLKVRLFVSFLLIFKFCVRGHTRTLVALLKHKTDSTEYSVPLEALKV